MGLSLHPTCYGLKHVDDGHTHVIGAPGPLVDTKNPEQCHCVLDRRAADELEALGEGELHDRMFTDMDPYDAIKFGKELLQAADRLEQLHANDDRKPHGTGVNRRTDGNTVVTVYTTFEEAIAEIRNAGHWYGTVGDLGFGVHAWY